MVPKVADESKIIIKKKPTTTKNGVKYYPVS